MAIENDAQVASKGVQQAVSINNFCNNDLHWEVKDYLDQVISLFTSFASCSFNWAPRECNQATHAMCR